MTSCVCTVGTKYADVAAQLFTSKVRACLGVCLLVYIDVGELCFCVFLVRWGFVGGEGVVRVFCFALFLAGRVVCDCFMKYLLGSIVLCCLVAAVYLDGGRGGNFVIVGPKCKGLYDTREAFVAIVCCTLTA